MLDSASVNSISSMPAAMRTEGGKVWHLVARVLSCFCWLGSGLSVVLEVTMPKRAVSWTTDSFQAGELAHERKINDYKAKHGKCPRNWHLWVTDVRCTHELLSGAA